MVCGRLVNENDLELKHKNDCTRKGTAVTITLCQINNTPNNQTRILEP